jgi:hypothetical protein
LKRGAIHRCFGAASSCLPHGFLFGLLVGPEVEDSTFFRNAHCTFTFVHGVTHTKSPL